MNPTYSIFEPCDSNQTISNDFETCNNVQTKTGRGGARKNSGAKSSGIETVTVRIDKRLLNAVTEIKARFKDGNLNLDDLFTKPAPKNDDAKLLKKIAKLEREKDEMRDGFFKLYESHVQKHGQEIIALKAEIHSLKIAAGENGQHNSKGLDEKLRKRLIHFCHPDKHPDKKEIATELTQALNGLAK
ncbi:MAG: hypothetical protein PHC99_12275 [Methylococcales bacterium]|nr:hypothetical protein [Methylococcales bacterium]